MNNPVSTQEVHIHHVCSIAYRDPLESDPAALQAAGSKAMFAEPATVVHLDDVEGCTHEVSCLMCQLCLWRSGQGV